MSEQAQSNVEIVSANRDLFEAVRLHNFAVIRRRRLGDDWDAPENQYRNAFAEVAAVSQ